MTKKKEEKTTRYRVELSEKQLLIIMNALEEWFRLRFGQEFDFCNDMASLNCDLSPENPNHDYIFNMYLARRDHLSELLRCFFRIAFEPTGYLKEKTPDMLITEDIWDSVRVALGRSQWGKVLHIGSEDPVKIEKIG